MTAKISIIAAIGHGRVLGKDNTLLWYLPDDLKRFKELTQGHVCIMGRNTFNSIIAILGKPLPHRTSVVLSQESLPSYPNVHTVFSLDEAIAKARELESKEIFICGGGQVYAQFLPKADKLYLTLIDDEKDGDTFFPRYEADFTKKIHEEHHEYNGLNYTWVDLER